MTAGWFADPGRRHEYRYYDGSAWADWVSDSGVVAVESLPAPVVPEPQAPLPLPPPEPAFLVGSTVAPTTSSPTPPAEIADP